MKKDPWHQCYQYCVDGDYNFLYYNMMRPKNERVMKNFDEIVSVGTDDPPDSPQKADPSSDELYKKNNSTV